MRFDTQAEKTNWVSQTAVELLQAVPRATTQLMMFTQPGGQDITATEEVCLQFRYHNQKKDFDKTYSATFCILPPESQFDLILGADDCRKMSIVRPAFAAMKWKKSTKGKWSCAVPFESDLADISKEQQREAEAAEEAARQVALARHRMQSQGGGHHEGGGNSAGSNQGGGGSSGGGGHQGSSQR
jgi:uncharacterized membrane protein YgcG